MKMIEKLIESEIFKKFELVIFVFIVVLWKSRINLLNYVNYHPNFMKMINLESQF